MPQASSMLAIETCALVHDFDQGTEKIKARERYVRARLQRQRIVIIEPHLGLSGEEYCEVYASEDLREQFAEFDESGSAGDILRRAHALLNW